MLALSTVPVNASSCMPCFVMLASCSCKLTHTSAQYRVCCSPFLLGDHIILCGLGLHESFAYIQECLMLDGSSAHQAYVVRILYCSLHGHASLHGRAHTLMPAVPRAPRATTLCAGWVFMRSSSDVQEGLIVHGLCVCVCVNTCKIPSPFAGLSCLLSFFPQPTNRL